MASRKRDGESKAKAAAETGPATPAVPYEPSSRERASLAELHTKQQANKPLPKVRVTKNEKGAVTIGLEHPDADLKTTASLLTNALGLSRVAELDGMLLDLTNILSDRGEVTDKKLNRAIAVIAGIGPRDQVEALLATQMLAVHEATVTAARRLANADNIPQQDSNGTLLNKLMRTFTTQVETLKKYRSTGSQKMIVEHVNVFPGAQAALGVFPGGMGATSENRSQSHGQDELLLPERAPMPSEIEAHRLPMQGASGEGQERVSFPRGSSRSPKGPR